MYKVVRHIMLMVIALNLLRKMNNIFLSNKIKNVLLLFFKIYYYNKIRSLFIILLVYKSRNVMLFSFANYLKKYIYIIQTRVNKYR